jgi:hypothetical protein
VQNKFNAVRLAHMTLGDCTFLYNVMKACAFEDTKINAESLGMVYGLTPDNACGMGLIHLGTDEQVAVTASLIPDLLNTYRHRRWHLGVAVMRINFGLSSVGTALGEYLEALRLSVTAGGLLKRDELQFFSTILEELASNERLPLMTLLTASEVAGQLARDEVHAAQGDRAKAALQAFSSKLLLIGNEQFSRFEERRVRIDSPDDDEVVQFTMRFESQPTVELAGLLGTAADMCAFPLAAEPEVIERRVGSYVEIVRTAVISVAALQLFLWLVTGCVIRLTELRARVGVLTQKNLPKPYTLAALRPHHPPPPFIAGAIQAMFGKLGLIGWLSDPGLKGYAAPNILEASLEPAAESRRREPRPPS